MCTIKSKNDTIGYDEYVSFRKGSVAHMARMEKNGWYVISCQPERIYYSNKLRKTENDLPMCKVCELRMNKISNTRADNGIRYVIRHIDSKTYYLRKEWGDYELMPSIYDGSRWKTESTAKEYKPPEGFEILKVNLILQIHSGYERTNDHE